MIQAHVKGLTDHPLRRILSEEMHARKLPHIQAPARLMQLILQRQGDIELEKLASLAVKRPKLFAESGFVNPK